MGAQTRLENWAQSVALSLLFFGAVSRTFGVALPLAAIQDLPRVTIAATDPFGAETGPLGSLDTAKFTVTRSCVGSVTNDRDLLVRYTISGTAINGEDYELLTGEVLIPQGASSSDIVVTPMDNDLPEGIETVALRLVDPGCIDPSIAINCYLVGESAEATAYILDNELPADLTVLVGQTATFTVGAGGDLPMFAHRLPLFYQWRRNETNLSDDGRIAGEQSPTLTISSVETADAGRYDVVISLFGQFGQAGPQAVSKAARLIVRRRPSDILPAPTNTVWRYTLLKDSQLIDECPPCLRPIIPEPMQGKFNLRLVEQNPLFSNYALEDISFTAGSPGGRQYSMAGRGTYRVGGEVALVHEMFLEVFIDDGITNKLCYLTNGPTLVDRPWPFIQITVDQTNGTFTQVYRLTLAAAPLRDIWFSTANGFTPSHGPTDSHVSDGDLLSAEGRVVRRNQELTARLGIMAIVPDLGLDAMDVLPGGEIVFSLEQDVWSETLGQLQQGDLLSERGYVVRTIQQLLAAFGPMPSISDVGLDTVHFLNQSNSIGVGDEIFFSIETNIFSEKLGVMLRRGDLLSSAGYIVQRNEELLARFHPVSPEPALARDYGLDALYIWPGGGEIWFSVEEGFEDAQLGRVLPGDLLSDRGTVIAGNRELLAAFSPLEDLADFGLDALFIVEAASLSAAVPSLHIGLSAPSGRLVLQWSGLGRVFQLEKATNVTGPYVPVGPPSPDGRFEEGVDSGGASWAFYRVRQW